MKSSASQSFIALASFREGYVPWVPPASYGMYSVVNAVIELFPELSRESATLLMADLVAAIGLDCCKPSGVATTEEVAFMMKFAATWLSNIGLGNVVSRSFRDGEPGTLRSTWSLNPVRSALSGKRGVAVFKIATPWLHWTAATCSGNGRIKFIDPVHNELDKVSLQGLGVTAAGRRQNQDVSSILTLLRT